MGKVKRESDMGKSTVTKLAFVKIFLEGGHNPPSKPILKPTIITRNRPISSHRPHLPLSVEYTTMFSEQFEHIMMMIIVYLPCFKQGTDYVDNFLECLGFIESSAEQNKADGEIIAGDMNFEWRTDNVGRGLFHSMAQDLRIKCCDELCTNNIEYSSIHIIKRLLEESHI